MSLRDVFEELRNDIEEIKRTELKLLKCCLRPSLERTPQHTTPASSKAKRVSAHPPKSPKLPEVDDTQSIVNSTIPQKCRPKSQISSSSSRSAVARMPCVRLHSLPPHAQPKLDKIERISEIWLLANDGITAARIKKNKKTQKIKFKVRCKRHLYTLVLKDSDRAEKLKQSLPPGTYTPTRAQHKSTRNQGHC